MALTVASMLIIPQAIVHAALYSVNSVRNGDFEGGVDSFGLPIDWSNATMDCQCITAPMITANTTEAISGKAARVDIGQTEIGFIGIWQSYPVNTLFSNFTERPDEIDFWFRLDPKWAGLGDFQIKFLARNAQELDYVLDPDIRLSYPNQTFLYGSMAGQPIAKYILLGNVNNSSSPLIAPPGQWVHFTRDVTADWIAPMNFYNATTDLSIDSRIKFVNSSPATTPNATGTWSQGETVVYDADSTGTYTAGDLVIVGTAPSIGTNLSIDSKIKFVDSPRATSPNTRGSWSQGRTVVYDADGMGRYTAGDSVIVGTPPAICTPCVLPGLPLDDVFDRLEFDVVGFRDAAVPTEGGYYGVTLWLDNVNFYWSSNTPPPSPPTKHYLEFNFTDASNKTNVDKYVQWKIFNATGYVGPYTRGAKILADATYTLEVYYPEYTGQTTEPYLIYRNPISFDTNQTIILPLLAEPLSPGALVAFAPPVLSTTTIQQDTGTLTLNVQLNPGSSSTTILAKVPLQPKAITKGITTQTELFEGSSWTYDPSLSTVRLHASSSSTYTFYFQEPPRIPNITFTDETGVNVNNLLLFNMTNSQGTFVPITQGQILPDEKYPYYLQAYYQGYRIYRNTLNFNTSTSISLQMLRLSQGYLVVNSTVVGIKITKQSNTLFAFEMTSLGPVLILVQVPKKPLYVELNGAKTADWVYDSTHQIVVIETSTQGTISLVYSSTPSQQPTVNNPPPVDYTPYYIAGAILLSSIVAAAAIGLYFIRREKPNIEGWPGSR